MLVRDALTKSFSVTVIVGPGLPFPKSFHPVPAEPFRVMF